MYSLLYMRLLNMRPLYMRPHTTIFVHSYYYMCVLILLYTRPHTTICVSSDNYICGRILLYLCTHTTVCVCIVLCVLRLLHMRASAYYYICVLILLYVSAYYYICAQALSAARKRRVAASLYVSNTTIYLASGNLLRI